LKKAVPSPLVWQNAWKSMTAGTFCWMEPAGLKKLIKRRQGTWEKEGERIISSLREGETASSSSPSRQPKKLVQGERSPFRKRGLGGKNVPNPVVKGIEYQGEEASHMSYSRESWKRSPRQSSSVKIKKRVGKKQTIDHSRCLRNLANKGPT